MRSRSGPHVPSILKRILTVCWMPMLHSKQILLAYINQGKAKVGNWEGIQIRGSYIYNFIDVMVAFNNRSQVIKCQTQRRYSEIRYKVLLALNSRLKLLSLIKQYMPVDIHLLQRCKRHSCSPSWCLQIYRSRKLSLPNHNSYIVLDIHFNSWYMQRNWSF